MRFIVRSAAFVAACTTALAAQEPTNLRVQKVVRELVQQSGQEVIGLGSWISGNKYGDVLLANGHSDHDLRLVSRATSPAEAQREWLRARATLKNLVQKEFGKDADKVLASINVYPPSQLMGGVEDASDALARFKQIGNVPNLGYNGPVSEASEQFAEGLYGAGAKAFTQEYEQAKGRLFYYRDGKVFMGATDLTKMSEGAARFDIAGSCNTTTQWADHLAEEMMQGRGDKVAKYLERLDRDLAKARDLSRLPADHVFRERLRVIAKTLEKQPSRLGEFQTEIAEAMRRARAEASIINRMRLGSSAERSLLRSALDQMRSMGRFERIVDRAGEVVTLDRVLSAVAIILQTRQAARYAGEEEYHQAVSAALSGVAGLASLPVSLVTELTSWVLETARQNGYQFAAATQEPWDLMAGVDSAVGRADAEAGRAYTLEQLVARISDEARLSAVVYAKAMAAADRGLGATYARDDRAVGEAIFNRCYPVILAAWRARREQLAAEYAALLDDLESTPVLMTYAPAPLRSTAGGRQNVTVTAQADDRMFDRKMERAKDVLRILCQNNVFSDFTWRWQGGFESGPPNKRIYEVSKAGRYPVTTVLRVSAGANNACGNKMARRFDLTSGVDLLVEGAPVVAAVKPPPKPVVKPAAPSTNPTAGRTSVRIRISLYGTWDGSYNNGWVWDREKWWGKDYDIPVSDLHKSFTFNGTGSWPVYNTVIRLTMQVDAKRSATLQIVADEKLGPGIKEHYELTFRDIPWHEGDGVYSLEGATMVEAGNGRANRYEPNPEMPAKSSAQQSVTFKDGVTLRLSSVDWGRSQRAMGPLSQTNFVTIQFYREQ